jgi:hypothetical protein
LVLVDHDALCSQIRGKPLSRPKVKSARKDISRPSYTVSQRDTP